MEIFLRTADVNVQMAMAVPEISIAEMRLLGTIDMQDILDRVDCLNLLNYPVIVSNYLRFFRVRAYLGRYTKGKVAFVLGIPNLTTLFDAEYYEGLNRTLAHLISKGIDAGEIEPGTNPQVAALALICYINGVEFTWLSASQAFSVKALADRLVDFIIGNIITE